MPLAHIDHLIVQASTLAQGVAWCEAVLGVTPSPGGDHDFMGTHNRLVNMAGPEFPGAYLEIIAINPGADKSRKTCRNRWFDMENPALLAQLARHGPQLTHWVSRVPDATQASQALAALGIDRGAVTEASRLTPAGLLSWRITLRDDGQRLYDGCLPTLIQWGDRHPTDHLPALGVRLLGLSLDHPEAPTLQPALRAIGLHPLADTGTTCTPAPALRARLQTPRGVVFLQSTPPEFP